MVYEQPAVNALLFKLHCSDSHPSFWVRQAAFVLDAMAIVLDWGIMSREISRHSQYGRLHETVLALHVGMYVQRACCKKLSRQHASVWQSHA